jgi:SAM-dependent methyltransferase
MPAATPSPQDSGAIKSYYDARYDTEYMTEHSPLEVERVGEVLASIPAMTVGTVLDFGCGRGAWTQALRRRFPSAAITGVDISTAAVERAREAFPEESFATFDGREAPYEDGAFDLVFSYHVLEHVLSLDETAAEMARLARRWICVCLPCRNEGSLEARTAALERTSTGELRFAHDEEGHLRRVTSDELATTFGGNGFGLVDAFFSNQFWGGIEFLLDAGPDVTHKIFGPRRRLTRATLDAGHLAFLVHRSPLPTAERSIRRKTARVVHRCAKPLTAAVVTPVRALARREWHTRKRDPGGSAQYLIFKRVDPLIPSAGEGPTERPFPSPSPIA